MEFVNSVSDYWCYSILGNISIPRCYQMNKNTIVQKVKETTNMKSDLHNKLTRLDSNWWRCITIEPSIALFQITTVMSNQLFVNLYLQKSCRFNATTEPDLKTPCDDEKAGQLFLTQVNSWRYTVSMTLMIIVTVLISSWSDNAGRRRRPLVIIPLIGLVLVTIIGCVFSYFWKLPPNMSAIAEVIVHGVTGGRLTVVFSSQLYICDITNEKNRTARLGVIHGINIIAIPIGSGLIGYMMRYLGFFNSYLICVGLSTLAVILAFLLMEDTSVPVENKVTFWHSLNPTRVYESFRIIFKKRAYSKRTLIIVLLCIEALSLLPILGELKLRNIYELKFMLRFYRVIFWTFVIGESSVLYLYLRLKFKWNEKDYSLFSVYKMTLVFIGKLLFLFTFKSSVLWKNMYLPTYYYTSYLMFKYWLEMFMWIFRGDFF